MCRLRSSLSFERRGRLALPDPVQSASPVRSASRQLQPRQRQNGLWQRRRGGSDSYESGSCSWNKNCRAPKRLRMQVCTTAQRVHQLPCCLLPDLQQGCISPDNFAAPGFEYHVVCLMCRGEGSGKGAGCTCGGAHTCR